GLANVAIAVLAALGLLAVGLAAAGAVAFGLATAGVGLLFAAVAATTAQLSRSARAAAGMASAVLGAAYLLRAVGDTGRTALTWLSPVGWGLHLRAYAGERWWVAGLFAGFAVVLAAVGYALADRRDVGAGLLAERLGPATAPSLRSPFALA